jgi:hypothetical protein
LTLALAYLLKGEVQASTDLCCQILKKKPPLFLIQEACLDDLPFILRHFPAVKGLETVRELLEGYL